MKIEIKKLKNKNGKFIGTFVDANISNKECLNILQRGGNLYATISYSDNNQREHSLINFLKKYGYNYSTVSAGRFAETVIFHKREIEVESCAPLYNPIWDGIFLN